MELSDAARKRRSQRQWSVAERVSAEPELAFSAQDGALGARGPRWMGRPRFFEDMQNVPQRERKGTPITLEVGDVLLYQGPNAPHWRDTLLGDYSYHMFLHFINHDGHINNLPDFQQPSTRQYHGRLEGKKGDGKKCNKN